MPADGASSARPPRTIQSGRLNVIRRSHRSLIRSCLLLALVAVAGCDAATEVPTPSGVPSVGSSLEPSLAASTSASPSTSAVPAETSVLDLEVGDCFSVESDEIATVVVVGCETPHEYEVFAVLDHEAVADAPYPGDAKLVEYADAACRPSFEEFVGHDYQTSIWYITSLPPTEPTWAEGDREIVCTLNQLDATQEPIAVMGSARGSGE